MKPKEDGWQLQIFQIEWTSGARPPLLSLYEREAEPNAAHNIPRPGLLDAIVVYGEVAVLGLFVRKR